MCVVALACLPLAYRFASCQKFDTSIPLPNFWLLKRLLFCKTEQSWKSQIPQILDFLKIWIFDWGARLSTFSWMDTILGYILKKLNLYSLKNLATINFSAHCMFIERHWFFMNQWVYLKEAKFGGLDFLKFVQIFAFVSGFIFTVCFICKVHREAFLKSTNQYSRIFGVLKT